MSAPEPTLREILVAGWFGPKGIASVIYGIFVLESHIPNSQHLTHLIALVVIGSMIAHSSTDVLIAHWFQSRDSKTPDPSMKPPTNA